MRWRWKFKTLPLACDFAMSVVPLDGSVSPGRAARVNKMTRTVEVEVLNPRRCKAMAIQRGGWSLEGQA